MAKISGGLEHATRLRKGLVEGTKLVNQALFVAAQRVQVDAQVSITEGAVSGAGHRPSVAPNAPNNDTGVLANNIETIQVDPLKVEVSSNAPYAAIQEFGGVINHPGGTPYFVGDSGVAYFVSKDSPGADKMAVTKAHQITLPARPYMAPALQKNKARITQDIARAINIANRRGK